MRIGLQTALLLAIAAPLVSLSAGCKKTSSTSETQVSFTRIDPATAGTVEGTVQFSGEAPPRVEIDMGQDPSCSASGKNNSEQYVVNDGNLANVFVYIKDGLGNKVYAPPSAPAVLDQKGCRYVPHVIGVMAGQPVEFRTSDPTMHNINVQPQNPGNRAFDTSQAPNGAPVSHTFTAPETMIPVRCNNHPWMQVFVNVAANPFFAVSDLEGHYLIRGLPPGTYTLAAVHEKLGAKEETITVSSGKTTPASFTFSK